MAKRATKAATAASTTTAQVQADLNSLVQIPSGSGEATASFGASGLRQYSGYVREEWLRALIGRSGMLKLREMRDNDPIIAAILFAVEMLLRGVPYHVEPDDEKNPDDVKAADFITSCIGDMDHSWSDFVADALSFLQYGFGVYEIVCKFRRGDNPDPSLRSKYNDGLLGWKRFAGRAQETLLHWVFNQNNNAIAMVQLLPTGGPLLTVPLSKCMHFVTTPFKQNPEGRSVMRSMYNSYFLKERIQQIEAIGVSRDLCGMIVATVPARWVGPDATGNDKEALANVTRMVNLVNNNEQSGLVIPAIYDANKNLIFKIELLSTAGRRQFATTEIINRYDHAMCAVMLADFITLGTGSSAGTGSHAQSKNKSDMFQTAVINFADIIGAEVRRAGQDLLRLNAMKGNIKVTHGDIKSQDLPDLGAYLLDLAQAGILVPDPTLEAHVRQEAGLPAPDDPADVETLPADVKPLDGSQNPRLLQDAPPPPPVIVAGKPPPPGGKAPAGAPSKPAVGKRRRPPL